MTIHTKTDNIQNQNLSIGNILRLLKPRDLYAIIALVAIITSLAFFLGTCKASMISEGDTKQTDINKLAKTYQNELNKKEYITNLKEFLTLVSEEEWEEALNLVTKRWKNERGIKDKNDLERYYRMTQNHVFKSFHIEESEEESTVSFYAIFDFVDDVPVLPERNRNVEGKIKDIFKPEGVSELKDELVIKISECFIIPDNSNCSILVDEYLENLTVEDFIKGHNIIELIGIKNELTPRFNRSYLEKNSKTFERVLLVNMEKENGQWKFNKVKQGYKPRNE